MICDNFGCGNEGTVKHYGTFTCQDCYESEVDRAYEFGREANIGE